MRVAMQTTSQAVTAIDRRNAVKRLQRCPNAALARLPIATLAPAVAIFDTKADH
jgi:hypothetical protein